MASESAERACCRQGICAAEVVAGENHYRARTVSVYVEYLFCRLFADKSDEVRATASALTTLVGVEVFGFVGRPYGGLEYPFYLIR